MSNLTIPHLKHVQSALDQIMDSHARALPAHHRHYCEGGCDGWLSCSQSPDVCPLHFVCPTCEQRQRDEFFQSRG